MNVDLCWVGPCAGGHRTIPVLLYKASTRNFNKSNIIPAVTFVFA